MPVFSQTPPAVDKTRLPCALAIVGLMFAGCTSESYDQSADTLAGQAEPPALTGSMIDVPPGPIACEGNTAHQQVRVLELINDARSSARQCGDTSFAAASPLSWDTRLESAARSHSQDMVRNNFFDHSGSDGSRASARVTAAGYRWRATGENIAAGQESVTEAVNAWLDSPGHCRNVMNEKFTNMALACEVADGNDYKEYWTQVLARPR